MRTYILPDWWDPQCETDPSLLSDIEYRVATFLNVSFTAVHNPNGHLAIEPYPNARFRLTSNSNRDDVTPALHAAVQIASAAVRVGKFDSAARPLSPNPLTLRSEILAAGHVPDLTNVVALLWRHGIPVLHVDTLPSPGFMGMACVISGRPVIVLGRKEDQPSKLLFHCAHEAGHIALGHSNQGGLFIVDEDDTSDDSYAEREADMFAFRLLNGQDRPYPLSATVAKEAAKEAYKLEQEKMVDAGHLLLSWGRERNNYKDSTLALKALFRHTGGKELIRKELVRHLATQEAGEADLLLLHSLCL